MSSRRKCEKRHIGFLTSICREGISQTVGSFALQILRQELLHCIPRKTRHVPWLLRCTPCFRNGHFRPIWLVLPAGPCPLRFESDRLASCCHLASFMSTRPGLYALKRCRVNPFSSSAAGWAD